MNNKAKYDTYLPISWDFRDVISEQLDKCSSGKVFYFDVDGRILESHGNLVAVEEGRSGFYIIMDSGDRIRADRVITLFGKVGVAYDEYDAFANACLDCLGGYDKDEI